MKITIIQTSLAWEDAEVNRNHFTNLISSINEDTDVIVLPEMFSTGFTMAPETVFEPMEGPTAVWMKKIASDRKCAVTGSVVISEGGKYYNRLLFVFPDGQIQHYDKRHLFSLAGEDKAYTAGKERLIVEYKGWRICPLICYDLRFPVWSRNTEDIDLLLYVANWPVPRVLAWDTLLQARAIENMCYVAGVNRIGQDNNGHNYPGHSQIFNALGKRVLQPSGNEGVFTMSLDKEAMLQTRSKFAFLNDRDSFTLQD